ncbi:MAG: c-type cytochrome [Chloroflexota bacterium]
MKKSMFLVLALVLVGSLALAACGGGSQPAAGETTARPATPAEFAGKTNPHTGDAASAAAGKDLYDINCAPCHGATGMGDGPTAASLDPKPKPLASEMNTLTDDYMLWRISEGGAFAPFNSAMPAWKASMSEDQMWQVITYLRTFKQ